MITSIKKSEIPAELLAGITLAALAIPEVMGYTQIAGTPVITGLYTLLIPLFLFAIFGSSKHLVVSADSATAAILASSLIGIAAIGSHEYVALAQVLALMSAGLLILSRIIGLGFMADFLSRTVLIGFLTGVGIQVAWGQVMGMLGIHHYQEINHINFYDLVISGVVIILIVGSRKINRRIPGALMAVVGFIIISALIDFKNYGVNTLGDIPRGLPSFGLPDVQWSWGLMARLLPTALSMLLVILAQSAATSRAYAAKYSEKFDENADLVGLSLANLGAALSGSFVVNGSPTKTQMVDSAGGRTQYSQIVTSLIVLLVLIFFTGPLSNLPEAVLSAVVFLIGLELIDLKGMQKIWQQRPPEFWVALATAIVVVFIGVEQGIIIAMVLSLIEHVRRSYRSQNVVLTIDQSTHAWRLLPVTAPQQIEPGLLVYRFAHTIYYANSQQLFEQVVSLVDGANPALRWICIDASAIADVDFTGAETIREIQRLLKQRGIRLVFAHVIDSVKQEFERYQITELIGQDAFYRHISDVVLEYQRK